jgi:hydroxymethylglutaryl-CoA synthase
MKVGIVGYGAALPRQQIPAAAIEASQGKSNSGIPKALGVSQKTVPGLDEDTATLATAAAAQALERLEKCSLSKAKGLSKNLSSPLSHFSRDQLGCLFIGSESHPYAVKPTGTIVASALGLPATLSMADLQFACKAGTQSLQIAYSYVKAEMIKLGLAIGADTAQSRPGDILEFTAGAGAAAYLVGSDLAKGQNLVTIEATVSVATDTPDFWRRPGQPHPEHAGRFSGQPAYFAHVTQAANLLMKQENLQPKDIDYCVFHTPNAKFPKLVAKQLGFSAAQLEPSLVVSQIGNTYAAASLLALANVLDQVDANKTILLVSYGSGSGSDAFLLKTTPALVEQRQQWSGLIAEQISQLQPISYQEYAKTNS